MQHRIIFLAILFLFSLMTLGDSLQTFAQVEVLPTTPSVNPVSDPVETAHDHYHERRYAEAIKAYEELIENGVLGLDGTYTPLRQSQKDSIRLMLGQSYAKVGEDPAAHRVFKEIVDENPNGSYATQAVHRLGNLYWQRYQFKEAIRQCKQILKQHPNTTSAATAAYLLGKYQQTDGKSEEAMESYKYFLETFPTSPYRVSAFNSLTQLYMTNQRYTEAEKLIQERMRHYPDDITLLEQLAELYQHQNAYPKALELYRKAIEQDPNNTNLRRKLGTLYAETGNTAQAVAEWEKVTADEANQVDQQKQLGAIYLSHKMYPEAIAVYQQAIRLSPKDSYLYTQLAAAYKIQGQIEQAAKVYIDALQKVGLTGNQRETIWNAMLEIYEGDHYKPIHDKLIAQLEKRRAQNPRNSNVVMTLGELYFYAGKASQALAAFTQLHQIYPTHTDMTLETYARMLERNENPQAVDFYKALITGSTDSTRIRNARSKLAGLYQRTEQWNDAIVLLEELVSTREASIKNRLLLGQMQLHGIHAPKIAQKTFQFLLTQRLLTTQLVEAQLGLAECHILLKRYTLAREVLEPIANRPNRFRAVARKLTGDSYFFSADFEQAAKEYNEVIRISKSDQLTNDALERIVLIQNHSDYLKIPLTDYATAVQLYLSGQTAEALQQCERSLETYPKATIIDAVWLLIGDIYREEAKDTEAINAYQQVVERESLSIPKALVNIAEIYRQKADFANAAATYTTLITDYPENVIVVHARQQLDEIMKLQEKR
ncbi:MAG: tetratricopeptide repeat protein [Candidatus Poribacteria bacterium]|nr:tetratricopeptide repeat protein [Candidatus Poribacteria bacterium]